MQSQTSICYLYGFSPRQKDRFESLVKLLEEQIELNLEINVVLIQDGVIGTTRKEKTPELLNELLNLPINVYAISPDIKARGMDPNSLIESIKGFDYEDLVDLLIYVTKIVSWM